MAGWRVGWSRVGMVMEGCSFVRGFFVNAYGTMIKMLKKHPGKRFQQMGPAYYDYVLVIVFPNPARLLVPAK